MRKIAGCEKFTSLLPGSLVKKGQETHYKGKLTSTATERTITINNAVRLVYQQQTIVWHTNRIPHSITGVWSNFVGFARLTGGSLFIQRHLIHSVNWHPETACSQRSQNRTINPTCPPLPFMKTGVESTAFVQSAGQQHVFIFMVTRFVFLLLLILNY